MILFEPDQYELLKEPLSRVQINSLFARSVVEKKVSGRVYGDRTDHPTTFYVVHPYGISLLFGDFDNPMFNHSFKEYVLAFAKHRPNEEWMQAYPEPWHPLMHQWFNGQIIHSSKLTDNSTETIEQYTRVNFKFNPATYLRFKENQPRPPFTFERTNERTFEGMKGAVIPKFFWDDAANFCQHGVGFSLIINNEPACTAFSAFVIDNQLELGIETVEPYRGQGFAQHTCACLIDYCLENHLEPVWSCRLENTNSYLLAQKLGFEPTLTTPFYRFKSF